MRSTRLRHAFGDPLFVRGPVRHAADVPRALEVGMPASMPPCPNCRTRHALAPSAFSTRPRRSAAVHHLPPAPMAAPSWSPHLMAPTAERRARAPGRDGRRAARALTSSNNWTCAAPISPSGWPMRARPTGVAVKPLLTETMVWAVRADHPGPAAGPGQPGGAGRAPARGHLGAASVERATRDVSWRSTWEGAAALEQALAERGLSPACGRDRARSYIPPSR